jgi:hypothetical protein
MVLIAVRGQHFLCFVIADISSVVQNLGLAITLRVDFSLALQEVTDLEVDLPSYLFAFEEAGYTRVVLFSVWTAHFAQIAFNFVDAVLGETIGDTVKSLKIGNFGRVLS